jgi:pyruvate kinase
MAATLLETEKSGYDDRVIEFDVKANTEGVMTNIASVLAQAQGVKAILVASLTGQAASLISRYRPAAPIYAAAVSERIQNQMQLSWGVTPLLVPACKTTPELIEVSLKRLLEDKRLKAGDEIVLVAGEPLGASGSVNMVELRKV